MYAIRSLLLRKATPTGSAGQRRNPSVRCSDSLRKGHTYAEFIHARQSKGPLVVFVRAQGVEANGLDPVFAAARWFCRAIPAGVTDAGQRAERSGIRIKILVGGTKRGGRLLSALFGVNRMDPKCLRQAATHRRMAFRSAHTGHATEMGASGRSATLAIQAGDT